MAIKNLSMKWLATATSALPYGTSYSQLVFVNYAIMQLSVYTCKSTKKKKKKKKKKQKKRIVHMFKVMCAHTGFLCMTSE